MVLCSLTAKCWYSGQWRAKLSWSNLFSTSGKLVLKKSFFLIKKFKKKFHINIHAFCHEFHQLIWNSLVMKKYWNKQLSSELQLFYCFQNSRSMQMYALRNTLICFIKLSWLAYTLKICCSLWNSTNGKPMDQIFASDKNTHTKYSVT